MNGNRKQAHAAQQQTAGFPLLQVGELHDCLYALGVAVNSDDISRPTQQTTQMIYAQLVEILMGAPMDGMEGPKASLLGMMEYKDLYGDALQFTMFYRHCRKLAMVCGVNAFNLSDLTRPESTRFRTVLSGIMNFAKFREGRAQFRESLQNRVQTQAEKTARLHKEVARLEAEIDDIKARNEADGPKTEEAKKANQALRSELEKYQDEQSRLSIANEELKKERAVLAERTTAYSQEINQLQAKHTSAKGRLVQSPDRIKRYISETSASIAAEKKQLIDYQRTAREFQNRHEIISNLERDLKDLIELSRGINSRRGKLAEAKRTKSSAIGKLDQKKIESQGHDAKLDQLDRQIRNAQEKLARQKEMTEDMESRAQARIAALRDEYLAKTKERNVWQRKRDQLLAEKRRLEEEIAEFTATHEGELNALLAEYAKIRREADEYIDHMSNAMRLQV